MIRKSIDIQYLPHQGKLLDAVLNQGIRNVSLRGGVGSGKTSTLAMLLYAACRQWPGIPYLLCSNTMTNLVACVGGMCEFWEKAGLKRSMRWTLHKTGVEPRLELSIVVQGKWVTVKHPLRSLYDEKNIVSIEVGGLIVDEAASSKEPGFMAADGRVRINKRFGSKAPLFKVYAGTPRGNNWYAQYISNLEEKGNILSITGVKTKDNPFLPAEFIHDITKKYEGTQYASQELDGEIVSMGDLCFPVVILKDYKPDPYKNWCLAVDFGFDFPALICLQKANDQGEWCIFHSCTPTKVTITDALQLLMKGLRERFNFTSNPVNVAYDPAGRSKSDQTNRSAADDLQDFFKMRGGKQPHYHYSFASMDRSIEKGIMNLHVLLSKGKIFIARHEEKKHSGNYFSVYQCFKDCAYIKNGNVIDYTAYKKDHSFEDPVDAVRYFCMFYQNAFDILDVRGHNVKVDTEVKQEVN